jgi:hypothetical protein
MRPVKNLLTDQSETLLGSMGTWTVSPNATIQMNGDIVKFTGMGSVRIVSANGTPIVLTAEQVALGDQAGWAFRAFVWIWVEDSANVTVSAATSLSGTFTNVIHVRPRDWTLCKVELPVLFEAENVIMSFTVADLDPGAAFYMTSPVIVSSGAITRDIFAAETYGRLPQYLREADDFQSDPDVPLWRFLETASVEANEIYQLWDSYRYIPPEQGGLTQAPSLLEPSVASIEVLRWLAQILGIRFYDPTTATTSWGSLESGLDPDGEPEWEDWATVPDDDASGTVTWTEIEEFSPSVAGLIELFRWQVETAYYGLRGGSTDAVIEAIKKILTGTKTVVFIPHWGGDPWAFKVQTLLDETPGLPGLGNPSSLVEEIAYNAIPAGFEMIHETVGEDLLLGTEDGDTIVTEDGDTIVYI